MMLGAMLGGIACLRRRWWAQRSAAVKPRLDREARPPAARTGKRDFQSRWRVSMTVVRGPGKSSELRPVSQ